VLFEGSNECHLGWLRQEQPGDGPSTIYICGRTALKFVFSPTASKKFYSIQPRVVPKGRGHAFNGSIYL
jgi:hypothetical protein